MSVRVVSHTEWELLRDYQQPVPEAWLLHRPRAATTYDTAQVVAVKVRWYPPEAAVEEYLTVTIQARKLRPDGRLGGSGNAIVCHRLGDMRHRTRIAWVRNQLPDDHDLAQLIDRLHPPF